MNNDEFIEAHLNYLRENIAPDDIYEFASKLMWTLKFVCESGLDTAIKEDFVLQTCERVHMLLNNSPRSNE